MSVLPIAPQFAFSCYPAPAETDRWAAALFARSQQETVSGHFTQDNPITHAFGNGPNTLTNRFVRFETGSGHIFYGYWQAALKQPAPLLVNLPGYGGYISAHPQIQDDNYNILHVSPLGYVSPAGADLSRAMQDGNWPVLPNTALGLPGGYADWLLDALLAVRWAAAQPEVIPDRISLYGTSQGGGGSLLLASLLRDRVRCVCADLPFLTAFPLTNLEGDAYSLLRPASEQVPAETFWNRLGYIDTLSHAHRLTMPVMLSAGGRDTVCPAKTVEALFARLPGTRQLTYLTDVVHTHSRQSMYLFRQWFSLFA